MRCGSRDRSSSRCSGGHGSSRCTCCPQSVDRSGAAPGEPLLRELGHGRGGASGAVFGLFGAILLVLRRLGRNAAQILVLIAINFAIGFFVSNIAWQAHLGGLVVGLALGAGYAYAPKEKRRAWSIGVTLLVAAALLAATLLKYASVPDFGLS
ncbi:rhomboid family intramembrane serine protease [Oerskovia sp. M15]